LKVGIFHPCFDMYGGAEFVAAVIANTLAQNGYEVELFVNKKIDQDKTEQFLGEKIASSVKIVLKPSLLAPRGMLDLYSRMFRSLAFKSKCNILLDTYSNGFFPWTDVCYFHFPYLNRYNYRPKFPYLKMARFRQVWNVPYVFFEKNFEKYDTKLLLANSRYTAKAIKEFIDTDVEVLYPPVQSTFFLRDSVTLDEKSRRNLVVTVSRLGRGKGVEAIPYIASLTDRNIHFVMIGLVHDRNVLESLRRTIKNLDLDDRIEVLTNVSRTDVKKILNNARIYLHTTVGEHFGISIVEGMAMGCLPVVDDSGGVKEYVPENFRYENIYDAARKIDKLIHAWSSTKAEEMMTSAERFSQMNFSREFMRIFTEYMEKRA